MLPNEILVQSLWFFCLFAFIGYCIGYVAEHLVKESVESRFRNDLAAMQARATVDPSESSER